MADRMGWVKAARSPKEHRAYRSSSLALCGVQLGDAPVWTNRARQACSECQIRDPERAEFIEFLIEYLADVEQMRASHRAVDPVSLGARFFDGAEPFLRTDLTHGGNDFVEAGTEPTDVAWPMDVRIITRIGQPEDGAEQELGAPGWNLQRWRSMDAKQIRGRVKVALPYPTEWTMATPADSQVLRWIVGRARPGLWMPIGMSGSMRQSRLSGNTLNDIFTDRMQIGLALWKMRPQQWRVYFSLDGQPGIELPSDPVGVRAAFRLRDIPDGKQRRAALRHWVSEHWRLNRDDPSEEIKVREHLRGATDFSWSGLHCRIKPSMVDAQRAAEAFERRNDDRSVGEDRRMVATS